MPLADDKPGPGEAEDFDMEIERIIFSALHDYQSTKWLEYDTYDGYPSKSTLATRLRGAISTSGAAKLSRKRSRWVERFVRVKAHPGAVDWDLMSRLSERPEALTSDSSDVASMTGMLGDRKEYSPGFVEAIVKLEAIGLGESTKAAAEC
ncbi:hypothetical protein ON010_g17903 [Phytophthora cinnamomi]|nr:hypothetical protein ON010_g17903 [Phytophthora cinnamomi]